MSTNIPKLGIFWLVGDEIISFSMPLDRAEHIGGFANYPHGHVHLWPLVQRMKPRLRGCAYESFPRGRVTYSRHTAAFNLLVPGSLLADASLVARLVQRFALPAKVVCLLAEEHYGPPTNPTFEVRWGNGRDRLSEARSVDARLKLGHPTARNRSTSRIGGSPKCRLYSRLNCDASS